MKLSFFTALLPLTLATTAQAQIDSTSGYATIGPLKMYYEIHGKKNGPPLVLIHGGGSTIRTSFGNVLNAFAQHRQVIAVELQAHGHTRDIDRPLSFQQDADDVAALLQQLHIDKADFFGFSNGGQTAMEIAIRHPTLIRKLVVGTAVHPAGPSWRIPGEYRPPAPRHRGHDRRIPRHAVIIATFPVALLMTHRSAR